MFTASTTAVNLGAMKYGERRIRAGSGRHRLDEFPSTSGARTSQPQTIVDSQSQEYNAVTSLALCCPITSQVKGYPFEVGLPLDGRITGVVLADQIRNLDWKTRRVQFECETTDGVVQEVIGKVSALLG